MTVEVETIKANIVKKLTKYNKFISISDFLSITRDLDTMEKRFEDCSRGIFNATAKTEPDKVKLVLYDGKLSFMERVRFLFNKEK